MRDAIKKQVEAELRLISRRLEILLEIEGVISSNISGMHAIAEESVAEKWISELRNLRMQTLKDSRESGLYDLAIEFGLIERTKETNDNQASSTETKEK